jgi:hypothetical protein
MPANWQILALGSDPNIDIEIANTDASMSRILLTSYIAGAFIALRAILS